MKYLKLSLVILLCILLFTFINANLSYFNIIKGSTESILNTVIIALFSIIGGIIAGSNNKGYSEGIKLGLILLITFLILRIIFNNPFTTYKLILYLSIIISTTLGSIIGKKIKIKN